MTDEKFLAELAAKFERETQVYLGYVNVDRAEKVRAIAARLAALTAENERLKSALQDIRDNYDHEEQTHDHQPFKYGGHCRVCTARAALPSSRDGVSHTNSLD